MTSLYNHVSTLTIAPVFPTARSAVKQKKRKKSKGKGNFKKIPRYHGVSGTVLSALRILTHVSTCLPSRRQPGLTLTTCARHPSTTRYHTLPHCKGHEYPLSCSGRKTRSHLCPFPLPLVPTSNQCPCLTRSTSHVSA